jgi:hypothetical protein
VFVPGKLLKPSLTNTLKFIPGLILKYYAFLEGLAKDKHSGLLGHLLFREKNVLPIATQHTTNF